MNHEESTILMHLRPWIASVINREFIDEKDMYTRASAAIKRLKGIGRTLSPIAHSRTPSKLILTNPIRIVDGQAYLEGPISQYSHIKLEHSKVSVTVDGTTFSKRTDRTSTSWSRIIVEGWIAGKSRSPFWLHVSQSGAVYPRYVNFKDYPITEIMKSSTARELVLFDIYKHLVPVHIRADLEMDIELTTFFKQFRFPHARKRTL
jgi:hypothetical protein